MSSISIGESIGEGFRLIGKRPVSVLVWGLARTALVAGMFSLLAPFYLSFFKQVSERAAAQAAGAAPQPPDLGAIVALQSASSLLSIVGAFVGAVLFCAIARAVLFPEKRSFAYMRVGAPELFLFLLMFGASIALGIGIVIAMLPIILIAGIALAAHAAVLGIAAAVFGGMAIFALALWVACRFSLIGPMMVQDGKFHFADAWALTKGYAGTLFLIGLLLFVVVMIVESVIGVVALALGIGFLGQAAGGLTNLQTFFNRPPAELLASLEPALVVIAVLSVPVNGAIYAIVAAPWARAYRDLAQPDVAATFA
jgi:hypothetical protein